MIYVVQHKEIDAYRDLMEQAYLLRHKVFVEEKHWEDLRRPDGREIDQFDAGDAVHMFAVDDAGTLIGYQRMLPTTKPHLLSHVTPQLCVGERPVGPHIWEWTRYCVDKAHRTRGRTLSPTANMLLSGIVEWGMENGVTHIIIEMDYMWLLPLVQLNFLVTPLGYPEKIEGETTIAVLAAYTQRTLDTLRSFRGSHESVLSTAEPARKIA